MDRPVLISGAPKIVVITGPTATGKTALGAAFASISGGEVVSADSMQVYKYMDIGTAKPSKEERLGVFHHMIDIVPPWEDYSVSRYVSDAARCIDDILGRGRLPVIVGGTGLYIDSLLTGRWFLPRGDAALRLELEAEYDDIGGRAMLDKLSKFDPESALRLHFNDKKRIVRAMEVNKATGKSLSQHDRETKNAPSRYDAVIIALTFPDRAELYSRIDRRVDAMLRRGLDREVRGLIDMGVPEGCTSMQAIGYKEMVGAIQGLFGFEAAAEKIKMGSRRYAKRQLTWLRRKTDIRWIEWADDVDIDYGVRMVGNELGL